jgi:hypothetical protein
MLFHVSEDSGIERFEPRPSRYADEPVVWAIDADRLRNYLLPRQCPRVTYYAGHEPPQRMWNGSSDPARPSSRSKAPGWTACGPVGCTATTCRRRPSRALTHVPATSSADGPLCRRVFRSSMTCWPRCWGAGLSCGSCRTSGRSVRRLSPPRCGSPSSACGTPYRGRRRTHRCSRPGRQNGVWRFNVHPAGPAAGLDR